MRTVSQVSVRVCVFILLPVKLWGRSKENYDARAVLPGAGRLLTKVSVIGFFTRCLIPCIGLTASTTDPRAFPGFVRERHAVVTGVFTIGVAHQAGPAVKCFLGDG